MSIKGLTPDQYSRAWKLRAEGFTWHDCDKALHVGRGRVRRALDESYAEHRRILAHDYKEKALGLVRLRRKRPSHHTQSSRSIPPDFVTAERERAMNAPLSITAFVCGDPPLGRSALDKRGA